MKRTKFILAGLVTAGLFSGVVGVAAGAAIGRDAPVLVPSGVTLQDRSIDTAPMPEPSYAINDSGQSVGSVRQATSPDNEPDLIAAVADDGVTEGYVLKAELDEADGTAAMADFTSPEDALRWQESQGNRTHVISVYESDGKTVIGKFTVGSGTGDERTLPPLE